jgi:hypothetical protein
MPRPRIELGPIDLHSNALPTELSRLAYKLMKFKAFYTCRTGRNVISESKTRKKTVNYRQALQALNWLLSPSDTTKVMESPEKKLEVDDPTRP